MWLREPERGVRFTTPSYVVMGSEFGLNRRVVLRAHRYPPGVPGKWWAEVMCVYRTPNGGRYRTLAHQEWPPFAGCTPGWPEDCAIEAPMQLDLLGGAA